MDIYIYIYIYIYTYISATALQRESVPGAKWTPAPPPPPLVLVLVLFLWILWILNSFKGPIPPLPAWFCIPLFLCAWIFEKSKIAVSYIRELHFRSQEGGNELRFDALVCSWGQHAKLQKLQFRVHESSIFAILHLGLKIEKSAFNLSSFPPSWLQKWGSRVHETAIFDFSKIHAGRKRATRVMGGWVP